MRKLTANRIIELLEVPVADRRPVVRRIEIRASQAEIVAALSLSASSLTRSILCDMLGRRHTAEGVPALVQALQDRDAGVRASAADALAKIGDPNAGPALALRLPLEDDGGVQQMLVLALGACQHQAAIPALLSLLEHPDATQRGCAAWSLGVLRAHEAHPALERALSRETEPYPRTRMEIALAEIQDDKKSGQ